ncbi:MAG: type pantothenate kinase [Gammaproteobacteria bacterium]|jgi:type III pantothenate kinase|nr:type pantothenate kinase [Gammaproteobacteria bacterium]
MLLCLDVGNTQVYAGLFDSDKILLRFRRTSKDQASSDEYGIFLRTALRENGFDPAQVTKIVMSSVVPEINHSVASACIKYFNVRPMILDNSVKTGLKICIDTPDELGGDLLANAIGATHLYPNQNLVVFDFGTANTGCVINASREYLGGLITPGLRLSMAALEQQTAQLPTVEIRVPDVVIGKNTSQYIQAGLYYSALGMVKEFVSHAKETEFAGQKVLVIGTGGFSRLFEKAGVFDVLEPDLVLIGLQQVYKLNA